MLYKWNHTLCNLWEWLFPLSIFLWRLFIYTHVVSSWKDPKSEILESRSKDTGAVGHPSLSDGGSERSSVMERLFTAEYKPPYFCHNWNCKKRCKDALLLLPRRGSWPPHLPGHQRGRGLCYPARRPRTGVLQAILGLLSSCLMTAIKRNVSPLMLCRVWSVNILFGGKVLKLQKAMTFHKTK